MLGGFTCDSALPLQGTYPIQMSTRYVLLGLFLSWISNPESSKNISPLRPLFSWILVTSSTSVGTFPLLDVLSSRKLQMLIQYSIILSSSPEEENAHMMSNTTPSQPMRTSLFSFNLENRILLLYKETPLLPFKIRDVDFLSIWEVIITSLTSCIHKSINYQFLFPLHYRVFILSRYNGAIFSLQSCDRFQDNLFAQHFLL